MNLQRIYRKTAAGDVTQFPKTSSVASPWNGAWRRWKLCLCVCVYVCTWVLKGLFGLWLCYDKNWSQHVRENWQELSRDKWLISKWRHERFCLCIACELAVVVFVFVLCFQVHITTWVLWAYNKCVMCFQMSVYVFMRWMFVCMSENLCGCGCGWCVNHEDFHWNIASSAVAVYPFSSTRDTSFSLLYSSQLVF